MDYKEIYNDLVNKTQGFTRYRGFYDAPTKADLQIAEDILRDAYANVERDGLDYHMDDINGKDYRIKYSDPILEEEVKYTFDTDLNESLDMNEAMIEKHDTLNPVLWTEDNELRPEVRKKIEEIVDKFKDNLEEDEVKLDIKDICLIGSNASYNYNPTSDLDIHIIADPSVYKDEDLAQKIYLAYKSLWNNKYDPTFNGIETELYVEPYEVHANSKGIYSLEDGWLKEPEAEDVPEVDENKIARLAEPFEERAEKVLKGNSVEDIDKLIDDIYLQRQQSIMKDGEFADGNLVFKLLRSRGRIEELRDKKVELENKEMSIEEDKFSESLSSLYIDEGLVEDTIDNEYYDLEPGMLFDLGDDHTVKIKNIDCDVITCEETEDGESYEFKDSYPIIQSMLFEFGAGPGKPVKEEVQEEINEDLLSENENGCLVSFDDPVDTLKIYLDWEGIYGFTDDIIDFAEIGEEALNDYLEDEGIYGYTYKIMNILETGEAFCSGMEEEDYLSLCRDNGIDPDEDLFGTDDNYTETESLKEEVGNRYVLTLGFGDEEWDDGQESYVGDINKLLDLALAHGCEFRELPDPGETAYSIDDMATLSTGTGEGAIDLDLPENDYYLFGKSELLDALKKAYKENNKERYNTILNVLRRDYFPSSMGVDKELRQIIKGFKNESLNEDLSSHDLRIYARRVLECENDEELKKIIDEIYQYDKGTYNSIISFFNKEGVGTHWKAKKICDALWFSSEVQGESLTEDFYSWVEEQGMDINDIEENPELEDYYRREYKRLKGAPKRYKIVSNNGEEKYTLYYDEAEDVADKMCDGATNVQIIDINDNTVHNEWDSKNGWRRPIKQFIIERYEVPENELDDYKSWLIRVDKSVNKDNVDQFVKDGYLVYTWRDIQKKKKESLKEGYNRLSRTFNTKEEADEFVRFLDPDLEPRIEMFDGEDMDHSVKTWYEVYYWDPVDYHEDELDESDKPQWPKEISREYDWPDEDDDKPRILPPNADDDDYFEDPDEYNKFIGRVNEARLTGEEGLLSKVYKWCEDHNFEKVNDHEYNFESNGSSMRVMVDPEAGTVVAETIDGETGEIVTRKISYKVDGYSYINGDKYKAHPITDMLKMSYKYAFEEPSLGGHSIDSLNPELYKPMGHDSYDSGYVHEPEIGSLNEKSEEVDRKGFASLIKYDDPVFANANYGVLNDGNFCYKFWADNDEEAKKIFAERGVNESLDEDAPDKMLCTFKIYTNDPEMWDVSEEEFEKEIKAYDGQKCVATLSVNVSNDYKDNYYNLKFKDGHTLEDVSGLELDVDEDDGDILYVIKDRNGHILSRPNPDDSELWDRVESRDPEGKYGLHVVVYTGESLDESNNRLVHKCDTKEEADKFARFLDPDLEPRIEQYDTEDEDGNVKTWYEVSYWDKEDLDADTLDEDTVKQNGKWVNKGKDGTHGKFKTKKAADAQRKAMYANGYKGESLDEEYNVPENEIKEYKNWLLKVDKEATPENIDDFIAKGELKHTWKEVHDKAKELDEEVLANTDVSLDLIKSMNIGDRFLVRPTEKHLKERGLQDNSPFEFVKFEDGWHTFDEGKDLEMSSLDDEDLFRSINNLNGDGYFTYEPVRNELHESLNEERLDDVLYKEQSDKWPRFKVTRKNGFTFIVKGGNLQTLDDVKDAYKHDDSIEKIELIESLNEDVEDIDRAKLLADYLEIDVDDIDQINLEFDTPEGDYYVLKEDEAYRVAVDDIRNLFEDIGLDAFTPDFRDWILYNCVDEDAVDQFIKSEKDYFTNDEPDSGMVEYLDNLTDRAQYVRDTLGPDTFDDWAKDKIDLDKVVEEAIDRDGVAHFISYYDGEEIDLGNGFYAYRLN